MSSCLLLQMIEKRRRDRINNSLNELRRLVPAAFEKQGSAKLEKAEILQMTVDHLTMLHAKGEASMLSRVALRAHRLHTCMQWQRQAMRRRQDVDT